MSVQNLADIAGGRWRVVGFEWSPMIAGCRSFEGSVFRIGRIGLAFVVTLRKD